MHVVVEPHAPRAVRRGFGAPEGLRALAALCFSAAAGALSLPPSSLLLPPADAAGPALSTGLQLLLVAAGGLLGLWFLIDAARRASSASAASSGPRAHVRWGLVTIAAGLATLGLVGVRPAAAAGRLPDLGGGVVALWMVGAGVTLIVLGVGALRPRPRYAHTDGLPRADAPSTRSVASWSPLVAPPPAAHAPGLSPAAMASAALPSTTLASGYAWRTVVQASRPLVAEGSLVRAGLSHHGPQRPERPSALLLAPLLVSVLPLVYFLYKFLQFLAGLVFGPHAG